MVNRYKYKITVVAIIQFFCVMICHATHNRGGEITFRHVVGYTYEVTVSTITYSVSSADRCEIQINWGDGISEIISRTNGEYGYSPSGAYCKTGEMLTDYEDVRLNKYTTTHTYSGTGSFLVSVEDPNRNYGVMNIPNSVNVPFYIETNLLIDNFMGSNDSPQMTIFPVDRACVGKFFISNAGAYDPDGDSLSYELVTCKGAEGTDIPGYTLPDASNDLYLDAVTGDFIWDTPMIQGEFNFAYRIYEWRQGNCIGYVTRDFQIIVVACDNEPPIISVEGETCVVAGDTLRLTVTATDVDDDIMILLASGEIFDDAFGAFFTIDTSFAGTIIGSLEWVTDCFFVTEVTYPIYFKATETGHKVNLSNIDHLNIRVIGDSPKWNSAVAYGRDILLSWDSYYCRDIKGYQVYRKSSIDSHKVAHCETNISEELGYQLIATVMNNRKDSIVEFRDEGEKTGLSVGLIYTYRIVAFWGSQDIPLIYSKASDTIMAQLKKEVPVITKVTVDKTDTEEGQMTVIVSPPYEIDTIQYPGPYRIHLFRSNTQIDNYTLVKTTDDIFNDTVYKDNNINTKDLKYYYYADLNNIVEGVEKNIGKTATASSVYLTAKSLDRSIEMQWSCEVPWQLDYYKVYDGGGDIVVDSLTEQECKLDSLINGTEYCYYVETYGHFGTSGYTIPVVNKSQIVCAIPEDLEAPGSPVLTIETDCEEMENKLTWSNHDNEDSDDIAGYYIYYQQVREGEFKLLDSIGISEDTTYTHKNDENVVGCYYVIAVDINGNESDASNICCVYGNECPNYVLPNVFTPNGDGYNDLFEPIKYSSIKKVEMRIYNRQGKLIYETENPAINWDGKDSQTKRDVSTGVYFYVCKVFGYSYEGDYETIVSGVVNLVR